MQKEDIKIKELGESTIEIELSISIEKLNKYREKAIKDMGSEISIAGFRKGHIPEDVLVKKIGELPILNETAEMALSDMYPKIIMENSIQAIGQPHITITKMVINTPVEVKIKIAIMPKFTLPDYKEIAKKVNNEKQEKIEVTEKEIEDTITQIRKMNTTPDGNQNVDVPSTKTDETQKIELAELNDEMVKKLGDFKDVADFKIKLKENIKKEKEHKAEEVKKIKIIDTILEKIKIDLPEIMVNSEIERMLAQTKQDITKMGLQFDKYLEHIKKTEEELRKELKPEAEKKSKIQLILDKIIQEEKIKPNEEEVKKQVKMLLEQHKEAKEDVVKPYVEMVLSNQEVFKLLERQ
ncbi:MAG: hypothetical protein KAR54_02465 [Candidatus Pacebacteria bacterium]|nr:hypothetical protein [Candidatus Paceibacterota bacterium]